MKHIELYIEELDNDICELIKSESEHMTDVGENMLHVLFENRKHVETWARTQGITV